MSEKIYVMPLTINSTLSPMFHNFCRELQSKCNVSNIIFHNFQQPNYHQLATCKTVLFWIDAPN
jgi:hypothetical protein